MMMPTLVGRNIPRLKRWSAHAALPALPLVHRRSNWSGSNQAALNERYHERAQSSRTFHMHARTSDTSSNTIVHTNTIAATAATAATAAGCARSFSGTPAVQAGKKKGAMLRQRRSEASSGLASSESNGSSGATQLTPTPGRMHGQQNSKAFGGATAAPEASDDFASDGTRLAMPEPPANSLDGAPSFALDEVDKARFRMRSEYWKSHSLPSYRSTALDDFGQLQLDRHDVDTGGTSAQLGGRDLSDLRSVANSVSSTHSILTGTNTMDSAFTAAVNFEDLYDPKIHLPHAPKSWKGYEEATPLSDYLMKRIGVTGRPLTTAEYMRQCLTHPDYGYYTNPRIRDRLTDTEGTTTNGNAPHTPESPSGQAGDLAGDEARLTNREQRSAIFGAPGDFITAPEVSNIFGHCLCVWLMTQWQQLLQEAQAVEVVELGPGRGTLMMDILSLATTSKLKHFGASIQKIHFVEPSHLLRQEQEHVLIHNLGHLIDFTFVRAEGEKVSQTGIVGATNDDTADAVTEANTNLDIDGVDSVDSVDNDATQKYEDKVEGAAREFSMQIHWHDSFASFRHHARNNPSGDAAPPRTMVVAQEMFDTLPVHVFDYTEDGWRERLIDVVDADESAPSGDPAEALTPRLRQVVAPDTTPAANILLKDYGPSSPQKGSVIEICPEAIFLIQDIQRHLEDTGGGVALIVDYGQEGTGDTLRAFSNHKQVPLTSYPGGVDITADVDFFALKETVNARSNIDLTTTHGAASNTSRIHAHGPVPQGEFLMRMGAGEMAIKKIEDDETTVEDANAVSQAFKFLVSPEHMGTKFNVLALAPKRDGIFAPAGME